jgi:hypothetical protein
MLPHYSRCASPTGADMMTLLQQGDMTDGRRSDRDGDDHDEAVSWS